MHKSTPRIWQLDALRGIAIFCMVIYHLVFDASFWGVYTALNLENPLQLHPLFWHVFQRVTAGTFLMISGAVLQLKAQKIKAEGKSIGELVASVRKQSLRVGLGALIMTAATFVLVPEFMIVFGVLHFLAVAPWLSIPIVWSTGRQKQLLALSVVLVSVGSALSEYRFAIEGLEWLGILSIDFQTLDYFPILPYWGVFIWGILFVQFGWLDSILTTRADLWKRVQKHPAQWFFAFLGEHSLTIYLLHQPILILLLWLVTQV